MNKDLLLFSGNSNKKLANKIANALNIKLAALEVGKFADGECSVCIGESVRGKDVFVIQSTSNPVNDNLMELLIIIDALRRASAWRITAVMPYFGYARQDRKSRSRDPITAKLVANLLTTAGTNRVLTMDLHAPQLQGFFDIPLDHLFGVSVLIKYLKKEFSQNNNLIVVSPDVGSVSRARVLATKINTPLAIVDKRRACANKSEVMHIVGDVANKTCIILDDLIDTGGTIINAAKALKVGNADKIYVACTHAVFSKNAIDYLSNPIIEKVFILDTIEQTEDKKISKIEELSVANIFASAIKCINENQPLSELFII